MFKLLLKKAVPIPRIEDYASYLFIGPHPDDIEVAAAPTVAKLTAAGKRVDFLIATDGCMGSLDGRLSGRRLAEIRKEEALASSKQLGAASVTFLDFEDGGKYSVEALSEADSENKARGCIWSRPRRHLGNPRRPYKNGNGAKIRNEPLPVSSAYEEHRRKRILSAEGFCLLLYSAP